MRQTHAVEQPSARTIFTECKKGGTANQGSSKCENLRTFMRNYILKQKTLKIVGNTYEMKYSGPNMRKQSYNKRYKGITIYVRAVFPQLSYRMLQRNRLQAKRDQMHCRKRIVTSMMQLHASIRLPSAGTSVSKKTYTLVLPFTGQPTSCACKPNDCPSLEQGYPVNRIKNILRCPLLKQGCPMQHVPCLRILVVPRKILGH